jgi:hypothetical protein
LSPYLKIIFPYGVAMTGNIPEQRKASKKDLNFPFGTYLIGDI